MKHPVSSGVATSASLHQTAPSSIQDPPDGRWRMLTEKANASYRKGDIPAARASYEAALAEAEGLWEITRPQPNAPPVAVIYNISCHNLAELAAVSGNGTEAEAHCRRACDRLDAVARDPTAPLQLRVACVLHLRHALAELVRRMNERSAPQSELEEIAGRVHRTAFSVFRVVRHAALADENCPHCPFL